MDTYVKRFKVGLKSGTPQFGLWCSLSSHVSTEVLAGSGFDWLLIDTEHAPYELPGVHAQLQAIAASQASPIVRPAWNDTVNLKRLLDIGVQTELVSFVQNAEEARRAVAATRYPLSAARGARRQGSHPRQRFRSHLGFSHAAKRKCAFWCRSNPRRRLTRSAKLRRWGGNGIFIGQYDLAADPGHLGAPHHKGGQPAIATAVTEILAAGKAPGILAPLEADARKWLEAGCQFVAVGSDLGRPQPEHTGLSPRWST